MIKQSIEEVLYNIDRLRDSVTDLQLEADVEKDFKQIDHRKARNQFEEYLLETGLVPEIKVKNGLYLPKPIQLQWQAWFNGLKVNNFIEN